jgi:HK97 family phage major capsid protein
MAGKTLVALDHAADRFIEALRAETRVVGLGATMLNGLTGDVSIPRMKSGATVYWIGENADATESTPVFDAVTLRPHQLAAVVGYSRRMLVQAEPAIEALLRNDLMQAIAAEVDRCAIAGHAADAAPLGLLETAGVPVEDDVSTALTFAHFSDLVATVEGANGARGMLGFLTSYTMKGAGMVTPRVAGGERYIIDDPEPDVILGHPVAFSSHVAAGTIIFGNWSDLLIGSWGGIDLVVDPYTEAKSGGVRIAVHSFWDFAPRRPASFAAVINAPTPTRA